MLSNLFLVDSDPIHTKCSISCFSLLGRCKQCCHTKLSGWTNRGTFNR